MTPDAHAVPIWSYLVPLAFIAVAIARNSRHRSLRVERMWIAPLLIIAGVTLAFSHQPPPTAAMLAIDVAALALGAAAGWWRGRLTHITVDPQSHALTSRTSPAGMFLILGLFVARYVLRNYAGQTASTLHISAAAISDALLLLAVGIVCAQRLEMALRATRLVNEARNGS